MRATVTKLFSPNDTCYDEFISKLNESPLFVSKKEKTVKGWNGYQNKDFVEVSAILYGTLVELKTAFCDAQISEEIDIDAMIIAQKDKKMENEMVLEAV
jgi:hypothetical protein